MVDPRRGHTGGDQAVVPTNRSLRLALCLIWVACVLATQLQACSSLLAGLREPEESSPAGSSLLDGVFTRRQASRGERRFQQVCAVCHQTNEITRSLLRSTVHETVGDLFEQISMNMPEGNPGSLSSSEYADILAFIFRLNDYPAGEEELPGDLSLLERVRIEAP